MTVVSSELNTRRQPFVAVDDPAGEIDRILHCLAMLYGQQSGADSAASIHGQSAAVPADLSGRRHALIACCHHLRATGVTDTELTRGLELMLRDASEVELAMFIGSLPRPLRCRRT